MALKKEQLNTLGIRILNASRTEILLSMPFMAAAFASLGYTLDLSTRTIGTDAVNVRFNPSYLFELYREDPARINRTYMHLLLHCLYRHMFSSGRFDDNRLFDLACDISVESVIDSIETAPIYRISSDLKDLWNARLKEACGVLTAEKIYRYFEENPLDYETEERLIRNYRLDDHSFWLRMGHSSNDETDDGTPPPDLPLLNAELRRVKEDEWDRTAKRVQSETELFSKRANTETGTLAQSLFLRNEHITTLTEYLKRYAVIREEPHIDPDSFDYGLYNYGLTLYGDLPLIEVYETREARKVEQLVIAIDTSASTQGEPVKRFLNETFAILRSQESFFHHMELHLIECDNQVQRDTKIEDLNEVKRYADSFTVHGGYGTDFTPVFAHVETLRQKGALPHLKGLLYFTDGFGTFPDRPTPYETAFVYDIDAETNAHNTPPWAVKVFLENNT